MHDIKNHIDRHCPECLSKDGLHWEGRSIACDECGCDWTVEDLLDELEETWIKAGKLARKIQTATSNSGD